MIILSALEHWRISKCPLKESPRQKEITTFFSQHVIAPEEGDFELLTGEVKPATLYINNSKTNPNSKRYI